MRTLFGFVLGAASSAVIASYVHRTRVEVERRRAHREGRIEGRAERPAAVRGLDAAYRSGVLRGRAHHPATFADRN